MTTGVGRQTIEELWQNFKTASAAGGDEITLEGLRGVMQSLGHRPTDEELRHILSGADATTSITFDKFVALVASLHGSLESRLEVAFDVFDHDGDGLITPGDLRGVLGKFGLTEAELQQIFREADRDGDGAIDFTDFCSLMPREHAQAAHRYRDSHIPLASSLRRDAASASAPSKAAPAPPAAIKKLPSRSSKHRHGDEGSGTSRVQMQIGLFRLLQGAAYRSFRENYSANNEPHLRAKKLPYTIDHFVEFVDRAIALYTTPSASRFSPSSSSPALRSSTTMSSRRVRRRAGNWPTSSMASTRSVTATRSSPMSSAAAGWSSMPR